MLEIFQDLPPELIDNPGPSRTAFRRAVENRLRPRVNRLRDDIRENMRYRELAPYMDVSQRTSSDTITFRITNSHPASHYLLARGGTGPHLIEQDPHVVPRQKLQQWAYGLGFHGTEANWLAGLAQSRIKQRGVIIPHPGTAEDTELWDLIDGSYDEMESARNEAFRRWLSVMGREDLSAE